MSRESWAATHLKGDQLQTDLIIVFLEIEIANLLLELLFLVLYSVQIEFVCRVYAYRVTASVDRDHEGLLSEGDACQDAAVGLLTFPDDADLPSLDLRGKFEFSGHDDYC